MAQEEDRIPDTPFFDRKRSLRGYRINKMAMGLGDPANREAFRQDEERVSRPLRSNVGGKGALLCRAIGARWCASAATCSSS